jgi:hypothetical protein
MEKNIKQVITMLADETKITLIVLNEPQIHIPRDSNYDVKSLSEFLVKNLTGTNVIEVDLNEYLILNQITKQSNLEPIKTKVVINGQEVEGLFYPSDYQVSIETEEGEEIEIPSFQSLDKQIKRAYENNSLSIQNFIKRITPVLKQRKHSVNELIQFIEKSELPLTNDGKIIAYKKVKTKGSDFVDCHTGNIVQNIGYRVSMDISEVDPDRYKDCSVGLHVANLDYIRHFHGNSTLIVIVDPANFIAVPHSDCNKARVCSYDIIGVIDSETHNALSSDNRNSDQNIITKDKFKEAYDIIEQAILGTYTKPTTEIHVSKQRVISKNSLVTQDDYQASNVQNSENAINASSLESDSKTNNKQAVNDLKKLYNQTKDKKNLELTTEVKSAFEMIYQANISKASIAKKFGISTRTLGHWQERYNYNQFAHEKTNPPVQESKSSNENMTILEKAQLLFNQNKFEELAKLKKQKKKSFLSLGFNPSQIKIINNNLN